MRIRKVQKSSSKYRKKHRTENFNKKLPVEFLLTKLKKSYKKTSSCSQLPGSNLISDENKNKTNKNHIMCVNVPTSALTTPFFGPEKQTKKPFFIVTQCL